MVSLLCLPEKTWSGFCFLHSVLHREGRSNLLVDNRHCPFFWVEYRRFCFICLSFLNQGQEETECVSLLYWVFSLKYWFTLYSGNHKLWVCPSLKLKCTTTSQLCEAGTWIQGSINILASCLPSELHLQFYMRQKMNNYFHKSISMCQLFLN